MSWSYNPVATPLDEVRFLTGDTDVTKPWTLQNEEINYSISLHSSMPPTIGTNYLSAAYCADAILAKLKGLPASKAVGDLRISYLYQMFEKTAYNLRQLANLQAVPAYAGGTSISEKIALDNNPDRVQLAVQIDGMDAPDTAPNGNQLSGANQTTVP